MYVCVVYFNAVCVDVQLCIAVVTVSLSLENELKKGQIRGVGLFYHPHTHIITPSLIEVLSNSMLMVSVSFSHVLIFFFVEHANDEENKQVWAVSEKDKEVMLLFLSNLI